MKMQKHADLGVRSALWLIQKQSPFCRNEVTPRETQDGYHNFRPEWNPPEAAVAWAIYERAVLDAHGFTSGQKLDEGDMRSASLAARTGLIRFESGEEYSLLSALGIDEEWALGVIKDVTARFDPMFSEGWRP